MIARWIAGAFFMEPGSGIVRGPPSGWRAGRGPVLENGRRGQAWKRDITPRQFGPALEGRLAASRLRRHPARSRRIHLRATEAHANVDPATARRMTARVGSASPYQCDCLSFIALSTCPVPSYNTTRLRAASVE